MLSISPKEILKKLQFDNPWWETSRVEKRYRNFPKRFYFAPFYKLVQERSVNRAVVLMGPRRVGKTVMIYHSVDSLLNEEAPPNTILYASLDTPLYTGLALEKIVNIFQEAFGHDRHDRLVIIFDEIQYLPGWEVHLKSLVDSYPAYKFVASGSAAAALKLKSSESGAGRFTDFLLPPLTFAEYISFIGKEKELIIPSKFGEFCKTQNINTLNNEFINYINYGGYPEAVFSSLLQGDSARYIKSDIIDKVLLRDLPSLYGIDDVQELNKLFTVIAYNTGNELSIEDLSKSSHVAKNTLRKYLEYLEAAFLIKIIHRVDINSKRFKRATSFKVYLANTSMRAALFGSVLEDDEAMGRLTETALFSQWFHSPDFTDELHYARWKTGEVDLILLSGLDKRPHFCAEIKWSDLPAQDIKKLKSLSAYCEANNIFRAIVTTKTIEQEGCTNKTKLTYIPSAIYTYIIGKNIVEENARSIPKFF